VKGDIVPSALFPNNIEPFEQMIFLTPEDFSHKILEKFNTLPANIIYQILPGLNISPEKQDRLLVCGMIKISDIQPPVDNQKCNANAVEKSVNLRSEYFISAEIKNPGVSWLFHYIAEFNSKSKPLQSTFSIAIQAMTSYISLLFPKDFLYSKVSQIFNVMKQIAHYLAGRLPGGSKL
jgi:hypothetical protein